MSELSTKPYLLRAIHEWCSDSGHTPYIAVAVDHRTVVPREFVRAGEIVLNISMAATNRLVIGNELIEFQGRFGGRAHDLSIPVDNVSAIYARENGHGMAFEVAKPAAEMPHEPGDSDAGGDDEPTTLSPKAAPKAPRSRRAKLAAVPSPTDASAAPGGDSSGQEGPGEAADPAVQAEGPSSPVGEESVPDTADGLDPAAPQQVSSTPVSPDDKPTAPRRRGKPTLTRVK